MSATIVSMIMPRVRFCLSMKAHTFPNYAEYSLLKLFSTGSQRFHGSKELDTRCLILERGCVGNVLELFGQGSCLLLEYHLCCWADSLYVVLLNFSSNQEGTGEKSDLYLCLMVIDRTTINRTGGSDCALDSTHNSKYTGNDRQWIGHF